MYQNLTHNFEIKTSINFLTFADLNIRCFILCCKYLKLLLAEETSVVVVVAV